MTGPRAPSPASPRVLMLIKRATGLGGMQVQAGRVSRRLHERGVPSHC